MRRHATLLTLLGFQALVLALSAFFQLGARTTVLEAFRAYDTELPPATRIALSPWFLPAAAVASIVLTAVALAAPVRRSHRQALVGAGVVVSSFALMFAVWAAFMPIFRAGLP